LELHPDHILQTIYAIIQNRSKTSTSKCKRYLFEIFQLVEENKERMGYKSLMIIFKIYGYANALLYNDDSFEFNKGITYI